MTQVEKSVALAANVPANFVACNNVATYWEGVHLGNGVDVVYTVSVPASTSDGVLSSITSATTEITTSLQENGYLDAQIISTKTVVKDISPTPTPSARPTLAIATVLVSQNINGVTDLDVEQDAFQNAFLKTMSSVLAVDTESVNIESVTSTYAG